MVKHLAADWQTLLQSELNQAYFKDLLIHLNELYQTKEIYPKQPDLFNAFNLCKVENLKVLILGQDPYHGAGQAHGLSFSVNDGVRMPPSLRNIFKELKTDLPDFEVPWSGNLQKWATEGVLLLNSILTVESGKPGSHKKLAWEKFTDAVISNISDQKHNIVFLLWGNHAIAKKNLIDASKHLVLTAAHPSPLARGAFFGCKHFSKTNQYLMAQGIKPIDWQL